MARNRITKSVAKKVEKIEQLYTAILRTSLPGDIELIARQGKTSATKLRETVNLRAVTQEDIKNGVGL